jgi:tetratricopeptide (TPR) repeat protein
MLRGRFSLNVPCSLLLILLLAVSGCATKKLGPMEQGIQNYEARQFDAAKTNFETVLAGEENNAQALYYLGRMALESGEIDTGVKQLEKAVELDGANSEYHLRLGIAYSVKIQEVSFFEKGQLAPKIKSEFEKAVETDPENMDARMGLAQFYLNAPPIAGGSTEKAMEQIEVIKKQNPLQGHIFMAQIHMAKKEYDEAEKELQSAVSLEANEPDIHYQLGMLYQTSQNFPAAFEALESAIQSDPDYMGAYYQIGRTAIFSGDNIERAIDCLQLYLKKDVQPNQPSWAHAHWRLGMLYEKAGEVEMAKKEYQAALELDSSIKDAKEALERLGN